ncbi:MAG TPA: substrate-binding domain-containing protein [Chitinophagales bacterium]|nr:substrate-binding domain-containing protein [Chitinophagales bacterium]
MKNLKQSVNFSFCGVLFSLLIIGSGCTPSDSPSDTATTGHIKISVDETFYPVIDTELDVFHALYKYAVITPSYVPEVQAMKDLLDDSVRLAIVTRELNDEEKKYFESRKLFPKSLKVATDAIALITHPENDDTVVTMEQLSDIFSGKINTWKTLNPTSKLDKLIIIFDNKNSSTARYIQEKFNTELPPNTYAVNTNPEVIDYVAQNKNALGVIGVSWISDTDDSVSLDFLEKINVLRIISKPGDMRGKQPYQAYIAQGSYPLTRSVYIINREARTGLGTGFATFVASDKGQRIILKAGLVPATMPVRVVGFNK